MTHTENLGRRITVEQATDGTTGLSNPVVPAGGNAVQGDYDRYLKEKGSVYKRYHIEADPGSAQSSLDDNGE
jgi:hypothetical protein